MFSVIPWKKYARGYPSRLMPVGSFPAIVKRMRNEFDELFSRFYGELPFPFPEVRAGWPWEVQNS